MTICTKLGEKNSHSVNNISKIQNGMYNICVNNNLSKIILCSVIHKIQSVRVNLWYLNFINASLMKINVKSHLKSTFFINFWGEYQIYVTEILQLNVQNVKLKNEKY